MEKTHEPCIDAEETQNCYMTQQKDVPMKKSGKVGAEKRKIGLAAVRTKGYERNSIASQVVNEKHDSGKNDDDGFDMTGHVDDVDQSHMGHGSVVDAFVFPRKMHA